MPEISRFFGMVILMFHVDHPPAHFHVKADDVMCRVAFESATFLDPGLTPRRRRLILEWMAKHQVELRENWRRARLKLPLLPIDPLE